MQLQRIRPRCLFVRIMLMNQNALFLISALSDPLAFFNLDMAKVAPLFAFPAWTASVAVLLDPGSLRKRLFGLSQFRQCHTAKFAFDSGLQLS
ncbi:hypothetical protein BDZ89DRAFT_799134 [Hymenopellis radicata]|nr:hypothetical protein BDZ89DRAFT_799134 [Hymenopellis radicata]